MQKLASVVPPIKANPVKAGDAKPWVYRHNCDNDCQAAEE